MNPNGTKLLELLFNSGEEICVSPDEFGWQSVPLDEVLMGSFILQPQTEKQRVRFCNPSDVVLVSINPIKGARNDMNVTAFRTFMVELDDGALAEQMRYVREMGLPYSVCVFSGGKSLHFGITLNEDLPNLEIWRFYAEWILGVMALADQQTKNPSRGIRMAGNLRNGREMKLVELKGRISLDELKAWLSKFPEAMPNREPKVRMEVPDVDLSFLPGWVTNELMYGIDMSKGRNNRWFAISYECGLQGWHEDDIVNLLGNFFSEEHGFPRKEWEGAVRSGARKAGSQ